MGNMLMKNPYFQRFWKSGDIDLSMFSYLDSRISPCTMHCGTRYDSFVEPAYN